MIPLPIGMGGMSMALSTAFFAYNAIKNKNKNAEMFAALQQIESDLKAIKVELNEILALAEWNSIKSQITGAVNGIETDFTEMINGTIGISLTDWATNIATAGTGTSVTDYLTLISNLMTNSNQLQKSTLIESALNYYNNDSSIQYPYEQVVKLERYVEGIQQKGYILLTNAYYIINPAITYQELLTNMSGFANEISNQINANLKAVNALSEWNRVSSTGYNNIGLIQFGEITLLQLIKFKQTKHLIDYAGFSLVLNNGVLVNGGTVPSNGNTYTWKSVTFPCADQNICGNDSYLEDEMVCDEGQVLTGVILSQDAWGNLGITIQQQPYNADADLVTNSQIYSTLITPPSPGTVSNLPVFNSDGDEVLYLDSTQSMLAYPQLLKGVKIGVSTNVGNRLVVLMQPLKRDFQGDPNDCLKPVLLSTQMVSVATISTLSLNQMRNAVIFYFQTRCSDALASIQTLTNLELAASVYMREWLLAANIYPEAELNGLTLGQHRNATIVQINNAIPAQSIADLQVMDNSQLMSLVYTNGIA